MSPVDNGDCKVTNKGRHHARGMAFVISPGAKAKLSRRRVCTDYLTGRDKLLCHAAIELDARLGGRLQRNVGRRFAAELA
jgi:hypothetical protein